MDISSLSHAAKTIMLARIAHELTVSARSTYVPGTETIKEPQVLRGYNELLHRVTASIIHHVEGDEDFPVEAILMMMQEFATQFNREKEIAWVLKTVEARPLAKEH